MQKLQYLASNAGSIPSGKVSSTARKGIKWFDKVNNGDVVEMVTTETGETLGYAGVVAKEALSYADVIANADHNHVGIGRLPKDARARLQTELEAAYGKSEPYETFTVLHLLPLTGLDTYMKRVVAAATGLYETAKETIATVVDREYHANLRAASAEYTASLLMDTVQQMQTETAKNVAAVSEEVIGLVSGASLAEEATGVAITASERSSSVGDVTVTTRVEFDPQ